MNRRVLLMFIALLLVAGAISFMNFPLASSQGVTLVARFVERAVPLDAPNAAIWEKATPVTVPLSAQTRVAMPRGGGSIKSVTVKALNDGKWVYYQLMWEDATKDTSSLKHESYRDAAAIQFPVKIKDGKLPSVCMGQLDAIGNIWHWKADWNEDYLSGFIDIEKEYPAMVADQYPMKDEDIFYSGRAAGNLLSKSNRTTPVENLISTEYGTITSSPEQNVKGVGAWSNGSWVVVFGRPLTTNGTNDAQFASKITAASFAVWDGSNGERDGTKSTSTWIDVEIAGPLPSEFPLVTLIVVIMFAAIAGFVAFILRRAMTSGG